MGARSRLDRPRRDGRPAAICDESDPRSRMGTPCRTAARAGGQETGRRASQRAAEMIRCRIGRAAPNLKNVQVASRRHADRGPRQDNGRRGTRKRRPNAIGQSARRQRRHGPSRSLTPAPVPSLPRIGRSRVQAQRRQDFRRRHKKLPRLKRRRRKRRSVAGRERRRPIPSTKHGRRLSRPVPRSDQRPTALVAGG